jgi:RNA polymerase sigma-70 factor (ECF subfamily)
LAAVLPLPVTFEPGHHSPAEQEIEISIASDAARPRVHVNPPRDTTCSAVAAGDAGMDTGLPEFLSVRPRLFGLACRLLGSASDAEDVVQDVWVRWQTADRRAVRNPIAFLVTATTRLAINVLHSARARRETCVGTWLREPVDTSADAGRGAERGEALNTAVMVVLETLSSMERAAYVLREAFNYAYREIAAILRVEEAHARQLVTRARQRVSRGRRTAVRPAERRRLQDAFTAAARKGDLVRLERLFASETSRSRTRSNHVQAPRFQPGHGAHPHTSHRTSASGLWLPEAGRCRRSTAAPAIGGRS